MAKNMNICIFEDNTYAKFYPLSISRPVYQLHCGILRLDEKIKLHYPKTIYFFHCRQYLQPLLKKQKLTVLKSTSKLKSCLFINGRVIADFSFIKKVTNVKNDTLFYYKNDLIAAYLSGKNLDLISLHDDYLILKRSKIKRVKLKCKIVNYIWDFIINNEDEIIRDANYFSKLGHIDGKIYSNVSLINKKNIAVAKKSIIKPGVVIDAEKGPVVINKNAVIFPNSTIIGPAFIGEKTLVKSGSKIYPGTSIGKICKVGGEIEDSIIQEYTNKQHEGFLGHSYLGSWCNLGADTNNSDLKNNYSPVHIIINGKKINTGLIFIGLFMGDHCKIGINTMFNAGSIIGFCSNVFGTNYPSKNIAPFSWFDTQKTSQAYKLDKAIDAAKKVMARRNVKFNIADRNIFKAIFNSTKNQRQNIKK